MNPLYLPERQAIRRKQADWTEARHQRAAYKRMRAFRWKLRRAAIRATLRQAWEVNAPFFGFLFYVAMWTFIALVFTALWLGFRR